jgi:hypothetical protein
MIFEMGDLVKVETWSYQDKKKISRVGVVVGRFLPHDFSLEEGVQVLLEGEKKYVRVGDCRCVNDE